MASRGFAGTGIVLGDLGDGRHLVGIDLDGCRDPETGAIDPWAQAVLDDLKSYAEVSPSGTSIKVFCTATDPAPLAANKVVIEKRPGEHHHKQIEAYTTGRYFAVTGRHVEGTPDSVEDADEAWERLAYRLASGKGGKGKTGITERRKMPEGDEVPPAFLALLDDDEKLAAAWHDGKKPDRGSDTSASGLDWSLALYLAGRLDDEALAVVLKLYPHGQIGKGILKGGQAERRLGELLKAARERREKPFGKRERPVGDDLKGYAPTEDGIALAFRDRYQDRLRYCHHAGAWHIWDDTRWARNETKLAFSWAREVARAINTEDSATLAKASTAAGVERFAIADPAFAVTSATWDSDPLLLGTPGGTLDLRTGQLRPAGPGEFITRQATVPPESSGNHPLWSRFLNEATQYDKDLQRFLQQVCGYALTGDIREHALFFVYGPGGNGKSVFLNVLTGILGDYAAVASMETLTASKHDRHPTDLAMLKGARLVTASETEEGRAWAESRIKQMTGGDPITARFMRQDFFTYQPQFKLVVVGNHKPALRNVDEAARRRFNIVPFTHKPPKPDLQLEAKLRAEWPAILGWMVKGCLDWQQKGLVRPAVVKAATAEYFEQQDTFSQWLDDCCSKHPNVQDTASELFGSWKRYAEAAGIVPGSQKTFAERMENQGFTRDRPTIGGKQVRAWKGVQLRAEERAYRGAEEAA